jgi:transcription antitermination factor NusG
VQPVFANYVFIELDDTIANWAPINSTLGVKRLLTLPGKGTEEYRRPSRIGFIESLRKLQLRSPRAEEVVLPAGTMVRITRGPFAEHIALVELSTQDRVRLLLEVFSREISIDFSPDAVEIVTRSGEGVPSSV